MQEEINSYRKMPDTEERFVYAVVEFTDQNSIAVVASIWLDGNSCALWPPYDDATRCNNAARRSDVPGDGWKSYPIKVWFKSGK